MKAPSHPKPDQSANPDQQPRCSSPWWGTALENEIDQFPRAVEALLDQNQLHQHLDQLVSLAEQAAGSVQGELDLNEVANAAYLRENPNYDPENPGELSPRHRKKLDALLLRCERRH